MLKDCIEIFARELENTEEQFGNREKFILDSYIPADGDYIVAPCDGVIKMIYPTLHAFGIENNDGLEILVHIGIDTINLKGQGFKKYVKEGQRVSLGDKVISVNNYQLKNNGIDLTTMMLFPNNKFPLKFVCKGKVKKAKTIVAMYEVKEKRG